MLYLYIIVPAVSLRVANALGPASKGDTFFVPHPTCLIEKLF